MKIFSTFTGIGGFELGIIKVFWAENIEIIGYAEIDKFSCAVLAHRFPGVKNYGDISKIELDELPDFDILVGGSPCQDLSISKNNREGLMGEKSGLFLEYIRILRGKRPAYFVLENVASMNNRDKDFISETVGVEPIKINSALLTAQSRNRYYRTNIPGVMHPKDLKFELQDILEPRVDEKYYIDRQNRKGKQISLLGDEKTPVCLIEKRTQAGVEERQRNKTLLGIDRNSRTKETAHYIAHTSKKANCLTGAIHPVNLMVVEKEGGFGENSVAVRMPTPIECERLQWFPDNWTLVPRKDRMMSDTQRYKQTWNAVTVNVIQHIFEALKRYLIATAKGSRASGVSSCFATPLPFPKVPISRQRILTEKRYVAFFKTPAKRKGSGLSVASQKAIVHHYAKIDKAEVVAEFSSDEYEKMDTALDDAISFCLKNSCTLIVATLDSLPGNINRIFAIKKKLDGHLKSCDLPSSDSLTLSIYTSIRKRQKDLISIRTKAAFDAKKAQGMVFGTPENLTAEGRKMGLEIIQKNASENTANQKAMKLISRCRNAGMWFGQIAKELNKNGFLSARGKQFYKATVKRLYLKSLEIE